MRDCISTDEKISFLQSSARIADSYGTVDRILNEHYGKSAIENEFATACAETKAIQTKIKEFHSLGNSYGWSHFYLAMYERLLTSILVDADRTDTACF